MWIFSKFDVHTAHLGFKDSDSVRRDGTQDSGFLASSHVMEMLQDKGPSFEYQDDRLLSGWDLGKYFTYSRQRFQNFV